uniref:Uncharacterized protein n=1 Tax=Noctiluca scintillans TaxID=2966 RepID=A0A7S0ZQL3_NOCSC
MAQALKLPFLPGQRVMLAADHASRGFHRHVSVTVVRRSGLLRLPVSDHQRGPAREGLQSQRFFTNWWHRYVDGENPDRPHGAVVSNWLRTKGVDPYLMPRDETEDIRKCYLTEYRYFTKKGDGDWMERSATAFKLLEQKQGWRVKDWLQQYPLKK